MAKSIGIDLGTTNSVCAIKRIKTEVLRNGEGEEITPSCVAAIPEKGGIGVAEYIVGFSALEWIRQDPANTVTAVKRLMGRNFRDPDIMEIVEENRLAYRIRAHSRGTENSIAIHLHGVEHTPEEISARILEKIRQDAENTLSDKVDAAVITVPAYFNDKQKHATRIGAALAGLRVRRLLPEPTAAALSFGLDPENPEIGRTLLVFDFGGGTLDLCVLTMEGGQFIEQGKGGDMWLGGEDIDRLLVDMVLQKTADEYDIQDMSAFIESQAEKDRYVFIADLRRKAEAAKIALSTEKEVDIRILGILKDEDGDPVDVDVTISRAAFEKRMDHVTRSVGSLTRKILADIHYTPDLIDLVLLVGGSSGIPAVVRVLEEIFGKEKVRSHARPMLAVAEGAAALSHRLGDIFECPGCGMEISKSDRVCGRCGLDTESGITGNIFDIVHSSAHDYHILLENGERHLLLEKNTPLPFETTRIFRLSDPDQKLAHLQFSNEVNNAHETIGDLWLGIPADKTSAKKDRLIEVTLSVDENNISHASAQLKDKPGVRMARTLSRGKADEKLLRILAETIEAANREEYNEYVMEDLAERSLGIVSDIEKVLDPVTDGIMEDVFFRVEQNIVKAGRMASEKLSSRAMIHYTRAVLSDFGPIIPKTLQKTLRQAMRHLEKMDKIGSYEENKAAMESLQECIRKELGIVNTLMQIQKAGDFCTRHDPSRAPFFYESIRNILEDLKMEKEDEALLELKKTMPEAHKVLREHEAGPGRIRKEISR